MDVQSHLPLTESTFFILLALAPGPQHGYAIMKKCAALSNSRVQMSASTLYGAIKRLKDLGWIDRSAEKSGVENGRERKAYELTDLGQRILNAETARLQSLVDLALAVKAGIAS